MSFHVVVKRPAIAARYRTSTAGWAAAHAVRDPDSGTARIRRSEIDIDAGVAGGGGRDSHARANCTDALGIPWRWKHFRHSPLDLDQNTPWPHRNSPEADEHTLTSIRLTPRESLATGRIAFQNCFRNGWTAAFDGPNGGISGGFGMKTVKGFLAGMAISSAVLAGAVSAAAAGDYNGDFMVRLQGTYLYTDDDMKSATADAGFDVPLGLLAPFESFTTNSVLPTATLTYFFSKNVAAELFCCFAKSSVKLDSAIGDVAVGDTWMFPPILTLQYHFDKIGGFKPYVGAGVQYIKFFSEDSKIGGVTMDVDDAFGFALQAGVDVEIGGGWYLNADVKHSFLDTTVTLTDPDGDRARVEHDLDPWTFSVGIGYRFNLFGPRYTEPLK